MTITRGTTPEAARWTHRPRREKKNLSDIPNREGISLATNDRVLRSRGPYKMLNQRIANMVPAGLSDLQGPSVFFTGLSGDGM
jgi:hypothetical protein